MTGLRAFAIATILLLAAGPASASDRTDIEDNFESVVTAAGVGAVVERDTVHRGADGAWVGLANGASPQIVTVDFGKADWAVTDSKPISAAAARKARAEFNKMAGGQQDWKLAAQEEPAPAPEPKKDAQPKGENVYGYVPNVRLKTASGMEVALNGCEADKCVTVVVAPWCPHCRAAQGTIMRLRDYLQQKDVPFRIVVSKDSESKVEEYAAVFGRSTLLDPENFAQPSGFPMVWVYRDGGAITGLSAGLSPRAEPQQLAQTLGVP